MSDIYTFTSESVSEGHPDKICDQISDAILDALIEKEYEYGKAHNISQTNGIYDNVRALRSACETLVTTGTVFVTGEIRTNCYVDVQSIVREVVESIGYNRAKFGFDCQTCGVINAIHEQSPDIALGVDNSIEFRGQSKIDLYDRIGAGDQGSVFGFASNEAPNLMPMPIYLAHKMCARLRNLRKASELDYFRPDAKTQVSVDYVGNRPVGVSSVVISTQHSEAAKQEQIRRDVIEKVIMPVLDKVGFLMPPENQIYINPTGRFVVGGPMGDSGLTGRKLIVDTYGGAARHGGGAFSGKDPTKVDRSASYAARWAAKNIVASGAADKCEIQISYAIGISHPVSICVNCFGTEKVSAKQLEDCVRHVFDLRPAAIIDELDLWRPIYRLTTNYGHFGRELPEFKWEKLDKVQDIKSYL